MLEEHLVYAADTERLKQYKTAVDQIINRGDSISDLGCGTGILGWLCLQAGATQVYAIDSTAMIEIARESLTRAGWGEQVLFIHGSSPQIVLPERVDVVICDQVGFFGFDAGIVQFLADARRRFLKPGGTLIPRGIKLQLAAVDSEKCFQLTEAWRGESVPAEFHWLCQHVINSKHAVDLQSTELLSAPVDLGQIDFHTDNPEYYFWMTELRMERDGVMHGLGGWFECELAEGVWMTNSPVSGRAIQRQQAFLPIEEPIKVKSGNVVKVTVMTRPADDLIAWEVEVPASGQKFKHSTWQGELLTREQIIKRDPTHVPRASHTGQARRIVLDYCDGQRTVSQIEEAILHKHPDLFPSDKEISRFVAQVLNKDTES